jgi:hypothetical protein
VRFSAGYFDAAGVATITWFDVNGNVLGSQTNTRLGIEIITLPGSIGGFTIELDRILDNSGYTLDNLSFELYTAEFEAIDSPLDTNPNVGGGLRVFPDRQTATDPVDRRRVRVKATFPDSPNTTVYFRSFDMDDPSRDSDPVDPNGSAGGDNNGTPGNGTLSAASAQTNASGVAEVEFTVTLQPGDNFRVAASTDEAYLNGVVEAGSVLQDTGGNTLPTNDATVTSLLTVWRRVHIEMDSMGNVAENKIEGTILSEGFDGASNQTTLTLVDQPLEPGQFENGRISIFQIGDFPVLENSVNTVVVPGNVVAAGASFTLFDDDDFNDDDGANLDGDEGENVTTPDTSLIQDSDDPSENVFAPAYVRPTYDIGDNEDFVSFVLNEVSYDALDLIATYDFDSAGTEADDEFWTVYLLGAYQHTTSADADPNLEGAVLGIVDAINGQGASVFNEVLRDRETPITPVVNNAATTAHEIGHLFRGIHEDEGLMAQSVNRTTTDFDDRTIDKIRRITHP